jgi:hypothetical protein
MSLSVNSVLRMKKNACAMPVRCGSAHRPSKTNLEFKAIRNLGCLKKKIICIYIYIYICCGPHYFSTCSPIPRNVYEIGRHDFKNSIYNIGNNKNIKEERHQRPPRILARPVRCLAVVRGVLVVFWCPWCLCTVWLIIAPRKNSFGI